MFEGGTHLTVVTMSTAQTSITMTTATPAMITIVIRSSGVLAGAFEGLTSPGAAQQEQNHKNKYVLCGTYEILYLMNSARVLTAVVRAHFHNATATILHLVVGSNHNYAVLSVEVEV